MFAAGFALGVLRTILVVALVGETVAVALELPIILERSPGSPLINRLDVPSRLVSRAVMGAVAFVLLMAGELSVSLLLTGRSAAEHLQLYRVASHMLGLARQLAFAFFPVLQVWMNSDAPQA